MKLIRMSCVALLCATMLVAAQATQAALTAAARRAAIERAADLLRTEYLSPELGEAAAKKIEAELGAGRYESLSGRVAFAQQVTADLQSVTHDKHVRVRVDAPASAPATPLVTSESGVVRADRLDGNIGYIEISGFPVVERFRTAVDRAMAALMDTRALIVDVRRNRGGSPDSVAYLVSHFMDPAKPTLLHIFVKRTPGTREFTKSTQMSVKTARSYRGKPVYVLTSAMTFSGGEEFAYDMQSSKLGTLVGETTGGGANGGGLVPIGSGMSLFVVRTRQENPVTGTNWEGVGVRPEITTAQDDALKVALEKLGQKPVGRTIEELSRGRLFTPR
jgi:hypothetical protein